MKQKRLTVILTVALAVVVIIGVSAYAASIYGTSNDPLVTLSYLNDKLAPQLMEEIRGDIEKSVSELKESINGSAGESYALVKLTSGQTLTCSAGTELLLRSGSASCAGGSFLDLSGGSSLETGSAVAVNHLYMAPEDGCGINVTSDSAEVLVRGSYTAG